MHGCASAANLISKLHRRNHNDFWVTFIRANYANIAQSILMNHLNHDSSSVNVIDGSIDHRGRAKSQAAGTSRRSELKIDCLCKGGSETWTHLLSRIF